MATVASRKTPYYYGLSSQDPESLALDALSPDLDWSRWQLPYVFPPFKLVGAVLAKARQDRVDRMLLIVPWHHSRTWFPMLLEARRLRQSPRLVVDLATEGSPGREPVPVGRLCDFWEAREHGETEQLSRSARSLIQASWRKSTESRYGTCWDHWTDWCKKSGVQCTAPSINSVVNFLSTLFEEGKEWRTINVYRSTLSSTLGPIEGVPVGKHPLVCRLMQGAFHTRTPVKTFPPWSTARGRVGSSRLGLRQHLQELLPAGGASLLPTGCAGK